MRGCCRLQIRILANGRRQYYRTGLGRLPNLSMICPAWLAIDGSKFKAVNNRDKNFTGQGRTAVGAIGGERRALSR
jgi:hypothetical protein